MSDSEKAPAEPGVGPRNVSLHGLVLAPRPPHCQAKLRLRSMPRVFEFAQKLLFVFLRHDRPVSAFLRPSGFVTTRTCTSLRSTIHVTSGSVP